MKNCTISSMQVRLQDEYTARLYSVPSIPIGLVHCEKIQLLNSSLLLFLFAKHAQPRIGLFSTLPCLSFLRSLHVPLVQPRTRTKSKGSRRPLTPPTPHPQPPFHLSKRARIIGYREKGWGVGGKEVTSRRPRCPGGILITFAARGREGLAYLGSILTWAHGGGCN